MHLRILAAAALAAAACLATARADELSDIKARGKLVCGFNVVQPYAYYDPQTRVLQGYEVDLCAAVAKSLGVTADDRVIAADARVPELTQGRVDVLTSLMSYSKERAEVIDYSNAYVDDAFYMVVPEKSSIQGMEELADKRIAVAKGTNYEAAARTRFPDAHVVSFDEATLSFTAMQQGKASATILRSSTAMSLLAKQPPGAPGIRFLHPAFLTAAAGFGIRKNEGAFHDYLDHFLADFESSGQAQALWDKWLGASSSYKLTRAFKVGQPIH